VGNTGETRLYIGQVGRRGAVDGSIRHITASLKEIYVLGRAVS